MANQAVQDYISELQAGPKPRRWWPKAIAICALLGAIYGAAAGSTISTTAGAADVIGTVAVIVAVLCGAPGARYGFLLGMLKRVRFGRLFLGTVAAIGGAILGGYLGVMAMTPLGAVVLGALGGWFFMRAILRRFFFRRLLGGLVGVVLGACIGTIIAAVQKDQAAALAGIAWGAGMGAVGGPLLFLSFMVFLRSLPHAHGSDRGNYIDATF